jgi:N6-adenosine-specific RNA methylase IME4
MTAQDLENGAAKSGTAGGPGLPNAEGCAMAKKPIWRAPPTLETRAAEAEIITAKAQQWAERITASWQKSVEGIFDTGKLIIQAKEDLTKHGEFIAMVKSQLPFSDRTARRLMAIAADQRLSKRTHVSVLPPHWGTLYELTKLDDEQFEAAIADGTINPGMERRDITGRLKQEKRAAKERQLGARQSALPQQKFGVILADPEWRFEPWSRETGMHRAADNHYPTSCTEVITAPDVPSIAADDCVLLLWATISMLPDALAVMGAWGFKYKSHYCWGKDKRGTGFWSIEKHELLLIGTRGKPPPPAAGTQEESLIIAPRGEHSAKPECFLEMIERWFPTLPKIELNRRGPARKGWSAWGNEAEAESGADLIPAMTDDGLDLPNFLRIGHPECTWRTQRLERAR